VFQISTQYYVGMYDVLTGRYVYNQLKATPTFVLQLTKHWHIPGSKTMKRSRVGFPRVCVQIYCCGTCNEIVWFLFEIWSSTLAQ